MTAEAKLRMIAKTLREKGRCDGNCGIEGCIESLVWSVLNASEKLEWKEEAEPYGGYTIPVARVDEGEYFFAIYRDGARFQLRSSCWTGGFYDTVEAAKEAAQKQWDEWNKIGDDE